VNFPLSFTLNPSPRLHLSVEGYKELSRQVLAIIRGSMGRDPCKKCSKYVNIAADGEDAGASARFTRCVRASTQAGTRSCARPRQDTHGRMSSRRAF
jgi:hypothetical protein